MARKKKKNIYKDEYIKERNRIKKALKRLETRGYLVDENILPDVPKRIKNGSINRLKNITLEKIYKKSIHIDIETGEVTPGIVYRDIERKETRRHAKERKAAEDAEYALFTDMVISEYKRQISKFPSKVASLVLTKLDEAIKKMGKNEVAYRLQYSSVSLSEYLNNVALFGDSIQAILEYCDAMFGDMPGMDNDTRRTISDIIDSESYSE